MIFDSLHSGSRAKVAATLRDYLACEYKAKMAHLGKHRTFDKETFRGCCPKVPQQPNFSDCGLYLLQYIEAFFEVILIDPYICLLFHGFMAENLPCIGALPIMLFLYLFSDSN